MSSALNIGTTGLSAASQQMDVIGNNLANANTVGFKSSETNFASMLSQSLSGGGGQGAVGQGVSVASISTVYAQGTFETTGSVTDLAIDGNGFFVVTDTGGSTLYTRGGGFHVANDGILSDINGYTVQGHMYDSAGVVEDQTLSDLNLQNAMSAPAATTYFGVGATLNTETAIGNTFSSSQVIYDSQGATHNLNTTFTKMEDQAYWAVQTTLDGDKAVSQTYSGFMFNSAGAIDQVYTAALGADPSVTHGGTGTVTTSTIITGAAITSDTATPIVLTRGADANTWTISNIAGYPSATVFASGTAGIDDTVGVDLGGGAVADITFTISNSGWVMGDEIEVDLTKAGFDGTPSVTVPRTLASYNVVDLAKVTQDTTVPITLTWTLGTTSWAIGGVGAGNYPLAAIVPAGLATAAAGTVVGVDLGGGAVADLTFTIGATTLSDGDVISFELVGPLSVTPTVTYGGSTGATAAALDAATPYVINNVGAIYKDTTSSIALTRGANNNTWIIANNGGYANAALSLGTNSTDDVVTIDLDGTGGADITFNLDTDTTWLMGDQINFALTHTESDPANIDVRFYTAGGALSNSATIGTDGVVTMNVAGLTNQDAPAIQTFATTSRIAVLNNDGYSPGLLTSLSVSGDGIVEGRFSNGQRQNLARILLADFANLQGLNKAGSYFVETVDSGQPLNNNPGAGGLGELRSNSLEMSNTDTAKEFIRMITAQRAYQSSAKIISTADQMLQTLMNVKQ